MHPSFHAPTLPRMSADEKTAAREFLARVVRVCGRSANMPLPEYKAAAFVSWLQDRLANDVQLTR